MPDWSRPPAGRSSRSGATLATSRSPIPTTCSSPLFFWPGESVEAMRVGLGFDVHPFSDDPARTLVLGGVTLAGERGLTGHSDADVIAHAVTDALLGAASLGDIGKLFPDTDPNFRNADSMALLAEAIGRVAGAGWTVANVDCAVVLEAPKLAPVRPAL